MKRGKLRRLTAICGMLFLLTGWNVMAAQAEETGSLQLLLPEKAAGAEMTLYQVAPLTDEGYIYSDEFEQSGIVIENLNDTAAAEEAADQLALYAVQNGISGTAAAAGEDGSILFDGLEPALYLTAQTGGMEYVEIQAALVTVPRTTDGVPVYDVTVYPKYSFPGGAVIATKVDEEGQALAQAYFTLQSKVYTDEIPDGAECGNDEKGSYYWKEYGASLVSAANGQIVVKDLPLGTYRFVEQQAPDGYILLEEPLEFVISESGTVEEVSGTYQEASGTVAELTIVNERVKTGSAVITKQLTYMDKPVYAKDATFYVALFEDAECTERVSEVETIIFENAQSSSVEFTDLECGKTYYAAETDEDGNAISSGVVGTDGVFSVDFAEGNEIVVEEEDGTVTTFFRNEFESVPENFWWEGELTICKKVLDADGNPKNSDEVFYAGVFADPEYTTLSDAASENVVTLMMDGSAQTSVTVMVSAVPGHEMNLYVTETDASGKPVADDPAFGYLVTIDKDSVVLSDTLLSAEVTITNQEPAPETETETETETEIETETEAQTETEPRREPETELQTETESESETDAASVPGTGSGGSSPVKTGDETPVLPYAVLLVGAGAVVCILLFRRRKSAR